MNRSAVTHSSWFVVAVSALGFGVWLGGREDSDSSPASRTLLNLDRQVAMRSTDRGGDRLVVSDGYFLNEAEQPLPSWLYHGQPLGESELRGAIDELSTFENPLRRSWLFHQLIANLGETNVEKTWDLFVSKKARSAEDQHHMALLAYRWGELDGEIAMQKVEKSSRAAGGVLAAAAMEAWARTDSDSAQSWIDSEERDPSTSVKSAFLAGLSTRDLQAATNYLINLQSESNATSHVRAVLNAQINQHGVEGAEQWIRGLADDELKANSLNQLARKLITEDPDKATSWVMNYAEMDYGGDAVASVAEALIKRRVLDSPDTVDDAMAWVSSLPDGPVKATAMKQALRTWASHNANDAGAYLGQLPESEAKDQAIRVFSMQVMRTDPEAAVRWASSISNPEINEKAVVTAARLWFRMDRDSANAWIAESNLSPEMIEEVTGMKPASH